MSAQTFNIFFLAALGMAGVLLMLRAGVRTCKDVLLDLGADVDWGEESDQEARSADASLRFPMPRSKALQLGLLEREEQLRYLMLGRLYPLGGALLLALLRYVFAPEETKGLLIFAGMGAALGYLVGQRREKTRRARYLDEVERFLPVVMERLVMGVEAGLDIIGAFSAVVQLEREAAKQRALHGSGSGRVDAVTELLELVLRRSESGMAFERSLKQTAEAVDSNAVKHAFVHLSLAYKEGGELIVPLRELSDSTQLCYQETVEEQIAKLPVKATLPLLCTFTGLIVCLLTAPIIQVIKILGQTNMT